MLRKNKAHQLEQGTPLRKNKEEGTQEQGTPLRKNKAHKFSCQAIYIYIYMQIKAIFGKKLQNEKKLIMSSSFTCVVQVIEFVVAHCLFYL